MNRSDAQQEIDRIRDAIDRVDEVIVRLLNQRAKYAIEIGEIKGILGLPIYAPEREKDVLHHVEKTCEGPLDGSSMRRLFERIIDESRSVERRAATHEERTTEKD
jgi:chorismate mutase